MEILGSFIVWTLNIAVHSRRKKSQILLIAFHHQAQISNEISLQALSEHFEFYGKQHLPKFSLINQELIDHIAKLFSIFLPPTLKQGLSYSVGSAWSTQPVLVLQTAGHICIPTSVYSEFCEKGMTVE